MMLSELLSTSAVKSVQRGVVDSYEEILQGSYKYEQKINRVIKINDINLTKSILLTDVSPDSKFGNMSRSAYKYRFTLAQNSIVIECLTYGNTNSTIYMPKFSWQVIEFS